MVEQALGTLLSGETAQSKPLSLLRLALRGRVALHPPELSAVLADELLADHLTLTHRITERREVAVSGREDLLARDVLVGSEDHSIHHDAP